MRQCVSNVMMRRSAGALSRINVTNLEPFDNKFSYGLPSLHSKEPLSFGEKIECGVKPFQSAFIFDVVNKQAIQI